ncbi:hypothetical protein [Proteiniphilum sp.]|uniref:hypothetical protein n=1 Tax=Proteiniphilum sp. TaxID=1926877 RepID=UPI002B1EF3D0|nr:hypothetical protein [Proteiniphilum sp.]MEA4916127.1 hypothetical protein [Proteiniphilum sp.]
MADDITVNYRDKYSAQQQIIKDNYAVFEVTYNGTDNDDYVVILGNGTGPHQFFVPLWAIKKITIRSEKQISLTK